MILKCEHLEYLHGVRSYDQYQYMFDMSVFSSISVGYMEYNTKIPLVLNMFMTFIINDRDVFKKRLNKKIICIIIA